MEEQLLKELNKKTKCRRLIEGVLLAVFALLCIIFTILYVNSMTVEKIGEDIFSYETVSYNYNFTYGIGIGAVGSIVLFIYLFTDFLLCGVSTGNAGKDTVVVYKGIWRIFLYVNGELLDDTIFGRTYLEGKTKDGVRITASHGFFNSYHVTFSDNRPPIDL